MKLYKRIKHKIYYKYAALRVNVKPVRLPFSMKKKKNIFLYFDYEREFGGHKTDISDYDIIQILDVLCKFNIKSTWFTVGRVIKDYGQSVKNIIDNGHEVASHTYAHVTPNQTNRNALEQDFNTFMDLSDKIYKVKGFHSPRGKWSLTMLHLLIQNGFVYDIANIGKNYKGIPVYAKYKNDIILRMSSFGDDWQMYINSYSEQNVFECLVSRYKNMQVGQVAGFGFHPWILNAKPSIYKGFVRFAEYLIKQEDVNIKTAQDYAELMLDLKNLNQ